MQMIVLLISEVFLNIRITCNLVFHFCGFLRFSLLLRCDQCKLCFSVPLVINMKVFATL